MTDQEIIKALQCCNNSVNICYKCQLNRMRFCKEELIYAAADRLEELTASQHVMKMREDA